MLEFLLLILTLVAIVATILLFVIANKLTDGRCWGITKAGEMDFCCSLRICRSWSGRRMVGR